MSAVELHTLDPEPVHIKHSVDGYPLCWPLDRDGEFTGTADERLATCGDCRALVASGGECAP